ncbi:MAG: VWA domain-containing protein, partial [Gemmatimonadota bacterium]|nr:VWA domain-containing protein [Gemmatimonadota bacterium]
MHRRMLTAVAAVVMLVSWTGCNGPQTGASAPHGGSVDTAASTSTVVMNKPVDGQPSPQPVPAAPPPRLGAVLVEQLAQGRATMGSGGSISADVAAAGPAEREIMTANNLIVVAQAKSEGDEKKFKDGRLYRMSPGRRDTPDADPRTLEPATQGSLRARDAKGDEIGEFPLRHTEVTAEVSGYVARTLVEQRYENSFTLPIEAVYVFPLPAMSAVNDFVMQVGSRKIVGIVRPRAEAELIYQQARARGQTASLLSQERPNIFTQNVANIEPGGSVTISITYFERLAYAHGQYEYVFPMVVGPRYTGGGTPNVLFTGSAPGGERVGGTPDAGRITPPVLKPGQRSGHDIGVTVSIDAGLPITKLSVPTHKITSDESSSSRRVIHLAQGDSIPNRDFVLRWSVAGAETQFGVLAHRGKSGGYFTLTMQPPLAPRDEQVTPREVTFIVDISGSMSGLPLETAKNVIRQTLDRLRPEDMFNLVYFESGNGQLFDRARPNTPENIAAAKKWLDNAQGSGGTEMLAGLRRALQAHHDPKYLQMYVFCTDGFIGDEAGVLQAVKEERGDARFFGFGIGSSVNRYLIEGIGEQGGGTSRIVLPRDSVGVATSVEQLFDAIDSPVLVDVAMDWNGLPVADVYPSKLGDLFAGQTINVVARFTGAARGTAYVTGRVGARRVRYPVRVELPENEPANSALAPVWARYRIADLSTAMLTADSTHQHDIERQITSLAVEHHLVSQYTSFVAVDESRIVGDGNPMRIAQPVELPEGVSYRGIFGEEPQGPAVRIGAWGITLQGT